ncbi:SET domain-containing protein SmydA-8 isoform X2 [Condylostylus longicornis]|uniref:SET domain-containing protein SmydA-8 isoform X2 n=1 Tax=Condylostylus longicornis TaxID=2530218 RepID=UPI00244DE0DF|nr:SET domain-containing protein SmydA-8 isoform X2 [Condylostylus longicornis]
MKQHKKKRPHNDNNNNNGVNNNSRTKSPLSPNQSSDDSDDEIQQMNTKIVAKSQLPYEIKFSDIMGRYLVASRHLNPGELIIQEEPLAVGPCSDSDPVCLGCYHPIEFPFLDSQFKCPGCRWPLCSAECPGIYHDNGHNKFECKLYKEKNIADLVYACKGKDVRFLYEVILPLRCLLLKLWNVEKWKTLQKMEHHNDIRKKIPSLWNRNQEVIVNQLKLSWKINDFTEDEIHTICGVIEVNCFEIGQLGAKARATYPSAFLLSHDCKPNTTHTDNPQNFALTIRVTQSLSRGDPITLSYAYTFQGTLRRREHLQEGKFFWCCCDRCKDPTELGTYASALKCPKCKNGTVLTENPLEQHADWNCNKCDYSASGKSVSAMLEKLFKELDKLDPHDILAYEDFLNKYCNVLTKDHYLNVSAKYSLCQLYGRSEGYLIHEMPMQLLERKEQYCRDVLRIVDILEPGLSRLRGVIMYELHAPIMIQTTKKFEMKLINTGELRKRLKKVIELLEESYKILSLEPDGSNEWQMALAAKDALKRIGNV